MKNILILFAPVLLLFIGCREETLTPNDSAAIERYYPLELNRPSYYQVDSIVLVPIVGGIRYDTARLEARETLVETYTGVDGNPVWRGERWERTDESSPYRFKQTYTITQQPNSLLRSEENLTFTKLVEPVRTGVDWDGNAAFDERRNVPVGPEFMELYQGWAYSYEETGQRMELGTGLTVDSVVTVRQADITGNLIDRRIAYERYAPGLGLVERYIDARHTQCLVCCDRNTSTCSDLGWDEKAEKGIILHQVLIARE